MNEEEGDEDCIDVEPTEQPDYLRSALDITGFQRDLLLSVAGADTTHPSGQSVRCFLESTWGKEVNESRLYQNLDKLREEDLVVSHPLDGRTKGYRITDRGRSLIHAYCSWAAACLGEDAADDVDVDDPSEEYTLGSPRWRHDL